MTRISVKAPVLKLLNELLWILFAYESDTAVCERKTVCVFNVHSIIGATCHCMAVSCNTETILLQSQRHCHCKYNRQKRKHLTNSWDFNLLESVYFVFEKKTRRRNYVNVFSTVVQFKLLALIVNCLRLVPMEQLQCSDHFRMCPGVLIL